MCNNIWGHPSLYRFVVLLFVVASNGNSQLELAAYLEAIDEQEDFYNRKSVPKHCVVTYVRINILINCLYTLLPRAPSRHMTQARAHNVSQFQVWPERL